MENLFFLMIAEGYMLHHNLTAKKFRRLFPVLLFFRL